MNRLISLIGAPTDVGAGSRGASMGPEALRVADIKPILESHGLEVVDRGNLNGPANPWRGAEQGYRHLDEVVAWNQAVHEAVHAELAGGRFPILLGATIAWRSVRSVRWRGTAAKRASDCACCGSTPTPTSTPTP